MITINNYLDLVGIFINEVIGSPWLAYFIVMGLLFYKSIEWEIPYQSTIALAVIGTLAFITVLYSNLLLAIIVLGVGLIAYSIYIKVIKR